MAARSKSPYLTIDFETIEKRMMARQVGKSHLLAMAYGKRGFHPLADSSTLHYKGRNAKFGNVHEYKTTTKEMNKLRIEPVPNTDVWFHSMMTEGGDKLAIVHWFKRHGTEEIKEAIATLIMMGFDGKESILLVRSFETR